MSHQVIRRHGVDGKLVAAGYQWGEENAFVVFLTVVLMLPAFVMVGVACLAMKTHPFGGVLLLGASALTGWCSHDVFQGRFRPRSLIFELDGSMQIPHGVPDFWQLRAVTGHHGKVGTIEKIRDEDPHGGPRGVHRVAMFGREGHIVRVSKALHPDDAHLVSVQLTAALQEIRDEIAWRARARGAR